MDACFKCKSTKIRTMRFDADGNPAIQQCLECSAREAYGYAMPRIVVQPYDTDNRFVAVTVLDAPDHADGPQYVIDRGLARLFGSALLSVVGD